MDASLIEADFSHSDGLTEEELRTAKTLYHATLPRDRPDLATKLADLINRPPPADQPAEK
jgi:hypothetical protein